MYIYIYVLHILPMAVSIRGGERCGRVTCRHIASLREGGGYPTWHLQEVADHTYDFNDKSSLLTHEDTHMLNHMAVQLLFRTNILHGLRVRRHQDLSLKG